MAISGDSSRNPRRRWHLLWAVPAALVIGFTLATPLLESYLSRRLIDEASGAGVDLSIGRLDLTPWRLRATASDIAVTMSEDWGRLDLRAAVARASLDAGFRLHLEIDEASAQLEWAAAPPARATGEPLVLGTVLEKTRIA